jgi:hypothetical protein
MGEANHYKFGNKQEYGSQRSGITSGSFKTGKQAWQRFFLGHPPTGYWTDGSKLGIACCGLLIAIELARACKSWPKRTAEFVGTTADN